MRKHLLLLIALVIGSTGACPAQDQKQVETVAGRLMELYEKAGKAASEQNYATAERLWKQMLRENQKLPEAIRAKEGLHLGASYYNLACLQALQQKKSAALRSFELAYRHGYDNYRHTLKDTDLDNLRAEKRFQAILEKMKEVDFLTILQRAPGYAPSQQRDTLRRFTYQHPNDSNLVRVREYFKLDSVAGSGDELSKIKRILTYIHNLIAHDGNHENPPVRNAIGLARACADGSRGLNCRGLAIILNECYLSMGWKARVVTGMPKVYLTDCHAFNTVYSHTLDKWLWVDPTFNAWVMDEGGNLLSIREVRQRLRDNLPVVLNAEANQNNRRKSTEENYLYTYMAKNLYYVNCRLRSEYNAEGMPYIRENYINLMPVGFTVEREQGTTLIHDEDWFWQSPYSD
ncbi:MAG: transglutaminase-like domain-containing protein [Prevotellaceae bacterium]|jgi:hypothetical protein|nr:transglutaminase-like domain-containing protein [Prevotellaceae bacterium]